MLSLGVVTSLNDVACSFLVGYESLDELFVAVITICHGIA